MERVEIENYLVLNKIGEGAFGKVYLGVEKETKKKVALKRVTLKEEENGVPISIIREITILRKASHKNIINILEVFTGDLHRVKALEKTSFDIYIVFPYMESDLLQLIKTRKIEEKEAVLYTLQILEGVSYLHSKGVIHRDIKPANILIGKDRTVKLADFGLARAVSNGQMTEGIVTRWYRAPEILLNTRKYSYSADIWSCGCVVAEIVQGAPLFPSPTEEEQLESISDLCGEIDPSAICSQPEEQNKTSYGRKKRSKVRQHFAPRSEMLACLLERLLCVNPQIRITADEAVQQIRTYKPIDKKDSH